MTIVKERLGANTLLNHIIYNDTPDNPRSYASYLLLVRYYKDNDDDYNDNWHYYFIARRHFLRRRKRENGGKHWNCHYCGEPVYKMQKRNTHKQEKGCITVDHIEAIGVGGDKLDSKNMVESCQRCNSNKGTKDYKLFILETHESKKSKVK